MHLRRRLPAKRIDSRSTQVTLQAVINHCLKEMRQDFPWIEQTAEFLLTDFLGDIDSSWKETSERIYLCKGDFKKKSVTICSNV